MASHSSILSWRIPWTEEPGGLHSPLGQKELDTTARDQPWLIQGGRSGDGVSDIFNYLFIKDIKSNRMRIAQ